MNTYDDNFKRAFQSIINDEWELDADLYAHADGGLSPQRRAEIDDLIQNVPEIARRHEEFSALIAATRDADPVAGAEPVSPRFAAIERQLREMLNSVVAVIQQ